jgi:CobQ/CobB/MinD/ParA nucleotide binding domain
MSERTITLHTFSSVKGGVGKSTLAITCAKLLAASKRVPVLIDCDLTGTSFADGLRLEAPDLALNDGALDLTTAKPATSYFSVDETRQRRAERRINGSNERALPPSYFNDVLKAVDVTNEPVQVSAALWRHERADGVAYLPSSSIQRDVVESLHWYDQREPFEWAQCAFWAIDDLVSQREDLTDVVLDLPTGTWGFSHEAVVLTSMIDRGKPFAEGLPEWHKGPIRWRANPFLVTSADGNDILPALEYVGRNQRENLPSLRPLANRVTEGIDVVRARARDLLGPTFAAVELEKKLWPVPEVRALGRIFKDGDVDLGEDVRALGRMLRLELELEGER